MSLDHDSTTASAVTVRPLEADDLPAYKALRDAALARHDDAFTSDAATEAKRSPDSYRGRLGSASSGSFTLGAFDGATLVGAVTVEREARIKASHVGHLTGMMVDDAHHGRGIGRALLAATLERARREGLSKITLNVTSTNLAAVGLYERSGFTRYGRLSDAIRIGERFFDKDLMVIDLR